MEGLLPSSPSKIAFVIAAFLAAGFFAYAPALQGEFLTWDDNILVEGNPNVHAMNPTTVKNVFTSYDPELYIPLTLMTYQMNALVAGMNPMVFHVTNLLFHITNALLVSWLLYLLIGNGWLALGLGGLFLLHPLNVEAGAWISARKDTLSTFFFLASLIAWMGWRGLEKRWLYGISLLLFVLGLLSKVMVVTLPVVLVFLDLLERRTLSRKMIVEKIPFFTVAILFGVIALFGKTDVLATTNTLQKILMACASTAFYLLKFVAPVNLSVMYPYAKPITITSPDFFIPVIIVLLLLALIAWLWKKHRLLSFGFGFFFLTLIPTFTNFAKGGDIYIASDRYAYIPMIGLLLVIGVLAQRVLSSPGTVRTVRDRRNGFIGVACALLVVSGYATSVQASTWRTSDTLYAQVLKHYPESRAAHNNLGMEYLSRLQPDEAIAEFDKALAINPDPKTKANRAAALVQKGLYDEALAAYEEVSQLDPSIPDAYYGIGNIHQKRGDLVKAAQYYRRALDVQPDYANALNNLGAVYLQLKDWDNAIATLRESIKQRPDFVESYYNLAGAYEQKGMKREAEEMYRSAIALHPNDPDALANLATLLYDRGEIDEAAWLLQKALDLQNDHPVAVELVLRMRRDGVAE